MPGDRVVQDGADYPPLLFDHRLTGEQRLISMERVTQQAFIRSHFVIVPMSSYQLNILPGHPLTRKFDTHPQRNFHFGTEPESQIVQWPTHGFVKDITRRMRQNISDFVPSGEEVRHLGPLRANEERLKGIGRGQDRPTFKRIAAAAPDKSGTLNEFRNGGSQCTNCHSSAEITAAGWSAVQRRGGNIATPANLGFFRIGVRPIADDIGFGGRDEFGQPLFAPANANAAGTFKAPGLRNVEFTGAYFHNGGQATLEQVLEFYARNGDFPGGGNLGPGIGNIRLNQGERTAIVAFLKALSDDRVRFQRAPFDHPSLCVPNGAIEISPGQLATDPAEAGAVAVDKWALVPEVGKEGSKVPLQTFEELLNGIGGDGTRANTMSRSCKP